LIALLAICVAGAAYLGLALVQVVRFSRRRIPGRTRTPSISVLKPIYGAELGLYESLASFCQQDYPDFEIVFCMHDEGDPARAIVERIVADFPHCRTRIVYGDNAGMLNPKIANLAKPGAEPHGEIVVLADSDIWVGRDYLDAIAVSFEDERNGAVTCIYGGVPIDALFARLAAMHSEEEFAPSVLVAAAVSGKVWFCLGATMAVRRSVLREIGGIEALGSNLADDYELGKLVAQAGHRVEISRYLVHTTIAHTKFSQLWTHELRWSRTNFRLTPAGHVFSFLMYTVPFALAYALLARNALGLAVLVVVGGLRWGVHTAARSMFSDTQRDEPWLIPLRDLISLCVWAASLVTRNVRWRGARHRM